MQKRIFPFLVLFLGILLSVSAQKTTADKVVAVVGDNIVLQSEVEVQYNQQLSQLQGVAPEPDLRCKIFDGLLLDKMFLTQANLDSLVSTPDEVDAELERRVRYFISLFGSKEKLEEYYGKSINELKDEFTDDIKNQLLSDKMKAKVFSGLKVTPQEVKEFYNKIPKDSVPYFNSELELAQIIMLPKVSDEQKEIAMKKIKKIQKEIKEGGDFSLQAILYSEDPGSASDGGNLGIIDRGELVPDFEAAAYKLNEKQMSDIVETPFGYHLIMLDEKRGNKLKLRHILIKPKTNGADMARIHEKMDTLQSQLVKGDVSLREAVKEFSDDEASKSMGGTMLNPKTGTPYFEKSEVDGTLIFTLDRMKVGEYSEVLPYTTMDKTGEQKQGYRIIYLKSESKPHKASLEEDYSKIQSAAKQKKQQDELAKWIALNKDHVYIRIDDEYKNCKLLQKWAKEEKQ
jgi:peptidyl-prolyl cis-trans isomerase SurA